MISMLVGWGLILSAALVAGWVAIPRLREACGQEVPSLEDCNQRLAEIDVRLREGQLNASEADTARIVLLRRLRPAGQRRPFHTAGGLLARHRVIALIGTAGVVFTGLTASSYWTGESSFGGGAEPEAASLVTSSAGTDAAVVAQLKAYTRSLENIPPTVASLPGDMLPGVDTMIDRLAAQLKKSPNDAAGWRMLGWSYFHTERNDEAVVAYARAIELDPQNAEIKAGYEEAKAKSPNGRAVNIDQPADAAAATAGNDSASSENLKKAVAGLPAERETMIRSMVESLASRLETSPADAEGWIRLIRSRVVLSERDKATAALRKALETFKDDAGNREKVSALASELGLSVD